jgi:hypothetical protein
MKSLSWRLSGSLKSEAQISPRKLRFGWSLEERGWELKIVSQCVCNVHCVSNWAREAWGAFYSPQENLAIGVSKTWTCPDRGPDMSSQPLWNPVWGPDMSGPGLSRWEIRLGRTCSGWGPDMSEKCLWNPAAEPDKAERPDMSGLLARVSGIRLGGRIYLAWHEFFGGMIDFDVLHFTNSPNESPLIVRSS